MVLLIDIFTSSKQLRYPCSAGVLLIKEIVATLKTDDLDILFRMDSGYFDEEVIEAIESLGCNYLIKAKAYSILASQVADSSILFVKGLQGRNYGIVYKVR